MKARALLAVLGSAALLACGAEADGDAADGVHPLPAADDGKADNYISTNAREFVLSGQAHVDLPEGFADRPDDDARAAELTRLVQGRLPAISRAVRDHIEAVLEPFNDGATGEDKRWFTYFRRDHSSADGAELLDDGRARFRFEMELVGSPFLMGKLDPGGSGARTFEVTVKDSWWSSAGEGEQVEVTIAGTESVDAFPRYDALFADGVLDIHVQFGGDYNAERYDIETARWLVEHLIEEPQWLHPEVTAFEDLGIDSAPFTAELRVEGETVEVRVTVVHSDMVEVTEEERLSDAMKRGLAEADIVIYSGHAGDNAGFILDYQPKHEIDDSAFSELTLRDDYQIYFFDGCRTYRTYVGALLDNPAKTFDNLDVVTTVNTTPFAVGYQLLWEVLYWFTLTDEDGRHYPLSWKAILRGLNTEDYASVHYGVHGVDQDPQLNPHGGAAVACAPCHADADCGPGGNLCLGYAGGGGCGVACTTDAACGEGYRCGRITDDDDLFYVPKQCIKKDYVCGQ
ncbi:MAG: hypothetical protein CSA66_05110 [Proteobacteria bacterium]|nr:MAG: hypothetical protein CSA66_05110 [Pseudomonadota bacterium]